MTRQSHAPSRRVTRALTLAACALSALAILGASAAAGAEPGTEEQPASAPATDVAAPAGGVFTPEGEPHTHGVLSVRMDTDDGQLFSALDSAGGYYGSSSVVMAQDPTGLAQGSSSRNCVPGTRFGV